MTGRGTAALTGLLLSVAGAWAVVAYAQARAERYLDETHERENR